MGNCSGVSDIYVIVGLSALLVSTDRAIPGPQDVKRAQAGSTFFFVYVRTLFYWEIRRRGSHGRILILEQTADEDDPEGCYITSITETEIKGYPIYYIEGVCTISFEDGESTYLTRITE